MYKELDNKEFDYFIIGTSLTESILSAYLSKVGKKVIHFDISRNYGGDCKNFTYKELNEIIIDLSVNKILDPSMKNLRLIKESYEIENFYQNEKIRDYNFDLNPKFLYGKSKAVDELSSTRASQYMEFVSVKKIFLHNLNKFLSIPCTKSEIFISEDLQLSEKQKLLNFIYAVMKLKNKNFDVNTTIDLKKESEVENKIYEDLKNGILDDNLDANQFLNERFSPLLINLIKLILGNLDPNNYDKISLNFLIERIYKYLNSVSVYDENPFIYPLYGSSEYSQALCRMSSVYGSIYIVNDAIEVKIFNNNEYIIDKNNKKYILNITDKNCDQNFSILTDTIIMNENFINSESFVFMEDQLYNNVKINENSNLYLKQFISFFIIENNVTLSKENGCPIFYKIAKNDLFYQNKFGFIVYEFDQNSYSAPKNRSLVQIIIYHNKDQDSISDFEIECQKIANNFIQHHITNIKKQIELKLNNLDKLDEETKKLIQSDDNFDFVNNVKILANFEFMREETPKSFDYLLENSGIVLTRNNYTQNDIDFYYDDAEIIMMREKWNQFVESAEVIVDKDLNEEIDQQESLIDELFDSIDISKK